MAAWTPNFYHAVFSTKHRVEHITPEIEERLYPFIGGILKERDCTPYAINGMADHVHVLVRYPSKLSHSDLLRHIKSRSSSWIHDQFPSLRNFAWQEAYGGFTVSKSQVPQVQRYIAAQKQRHARQSFQDEVRELLRLNQIEFAESEIFD